MEAIRNTTNWSAYAAQLIADVQWAVRRHFDIKKLRILLYPSNLTPHDERSILGSDIDHRTGLSLVTSESPAFTHGLINFRYRLAVEYLIHDQRMTIGEIIRQPPGFREVEAEVIAGLREGRARIRRQVRPGG